MAQLYDDIIIIITQVLKLYEKSDQVKGYCLVFKLHSSTMLLLCDSDNKTWRYLWCSLFNSKQMRHSMLFIPEGFVNSSILQVRVPQDDFVSLFSTRLHCLF